MIPVELARYAVAQRNLVSKYQVNQFIKCIDTWLLLKQVTRSGKIQQWNRQKNDLLKLCKCSENIFRLRLKQLQKLNFLHYDKNNIQIASYETIENNLLIDTAKKFEIVYDLTNTQRLQEWIIAAEIQDNQERQDYMILKRVNKNPHINMQLTAAMLKDGANATRLNDGRYFLSQMKALYLSDFVAASEIHDTLIDVRPDNNRGVKAIGKAWNTKHAMTVSYWKKILAAAGIIDISKLMIQSCDRTRNKNCKVIWNKKDKQTVLVLADQITVLQPWTIKNFLPA